MYGENNLKKKQNLFDAGVQPVVAEERDWPVEPSSVGRWVARSTSPTFGKTLLRLPGARLLAPSRSPTRRCSPFQVRNTIHRIYFLNIILTFFSLTFFLGGGIWIFPWDFIGYTFSHPFYLKWSFLSVVFECFSDVKKSPLGDHFCIFRGYETGTYSFITIIKYE